MALMEFKLKEEGLVERNEKDNVIDGCQDIG